MPVRLSKCGWVGTKVVVSQADFRAAVDALSRGGLVVYPTDTLYGLGADPFSDEALNRLRTAKGRPANAPISVAVADLDALSRLCVLDGPAERFCRANLPGPLTVVARATDRAPKGVLTADRKIGLRIPDHPISLALAKHFGPLTATSANVHGERSPDEAKIAIDQLGNVVDVIFDCGPTPHRRESTVVDVSGPEIKVIREGVLSRGDLKHG